MPPTTRDPIMEKYGRYGGPQSAKTPNARNKKLKARLQRSDEQFRRAAEEAADAEALLTERQGLIEPENEMEQTFRVTQEQILESVDQATQGKRFTLKLDTHGPYVAKYSQTGNHLLLGGRLGHIASMNWKEGVPGCELNLNETVHDVQYLQNDNEFFAVAQKRHTYIYNQHGVEVHELSKHVGTTRLDYLPYHYLLVTGGTSGYIRYQDVSTGELAAELRSRQGHTTALTHSRYNAVVHSGHQNGTVTLWAPNMSTPLAKVLNSRGPVRAIAIDRSGNYMAASGQDRTMKIWDIRNFKMLESYYTPTPATTLSISDTGLLAVGWGPHVQVWRDALTRSGERPSAPYMTHLVPGQQVSSLRFCPYEDVLGAGVSSGFESLIVPGSGEANIDALEMNPYTYATRTGRREAQVHSLLDKIQPDMITLDPSDIGKVDRRSNAQRLNAAAQEAEEQAQALLDAQKLAPRPGVRPKNSAIRRLLRKKTRNVVDERKARIQAAMERERAARERYARAQRGLPEEEEQAGAALRRFM